MRAEAAEGQHVAISGFQLAVDPHAIDPITHGIDTLDVLAEAEFYTQRLGHLGQFAGEQLAIAGLVIRQAQRAGQLVGDCSQGRLNAGDAGAVEQLIGHAGLLEYGNVFRRVIQLRLGAEQLGGAQAAAFIGDAGFRTQLVEAIAAVLGQTHHALLVHRVTAGSAVAQHLRHPQVLVDIGGGLDRQRCMFLQQPLDGFQRYARRRPRRGIARRHLASIGEAGFHGRGVLPVDHHHFKALTRQVIRTGCTNYTAAENQNPHDTLLAATMRGG